MSLFRKKTSYTTVKVKKKDLPDGLWIKCPGTGEIIYKDDLTKNNEVCPTCSYHFMLPRKKELNYYLIKILLKNGQERLNQSTR